MIRPLRTCLGLAAAVALAACGDKAAQAPVPSEYDWPDSMSYRMDYVAETQRQGQPLLHYAETKTTRFAIRDNQYLGAQDSVLKTSQRPGEGLRLLTYTPEDTLGFYVAIGRHGELSPVTMGCDPAVPECAAALPSSVALELRRWIPRLPVWPAPRGAQWEDTLEFDESARPGGLVTSMITRYTARNDTVVGGTAYWVIAWRSVRASVSRRRNDLAGTSPTQEFGVTFIEKAKLMPAYASWAGALPAPPELQQMGATGTGYRGRAYRTGTPFDSLYSRQVGP
jgi:hypothetical protein